MFNKTRIFLTVQETPDCKWDIDNRGECFYKDIYEILPIQTGQSMSFRTRDELYFTEIRSIMWLTDIAAMGVYTETINTKKEDYSNLCYVLECQGWSVCKINNI